MKAIKIALLSGLIFLASCGSDIIRPPEREIVQTIKKNSEKSADGSSSENITALYFEAKSKPKKACQNFTSLSNKNNFPLKKLALIKRLKHCSYTITEIQNIWKRIKSSELSFEHEEYYRVSYKIAKKNSLFNKIVELGIKLAPYYRLRKKRTNLYKEILKSAKSSKDKTLILKAETAFHNYSPRYIKNPKISELYRVARDWERDRNFIRARKIYRKIIDSKKSSLEDKSKSYKRYAFSYKLQRRKDDYLKKLHLYTKWLKKQKGIETSQVHENQILVARTMWTLNNLTGGKKILKGLLKKKKLSYQNRGEIFWVLSSMDWEKKRYRESLSHLNQIKVNKITSKSLREKIYWAKSWTYYLLKDFRNASQSFSDAYKNNENIYFQYKVKFWHGKSLAKLKEEDDAQDIWEELTEEDPFGHYGILAHMELKKEMASYDKKINPEDIPLTLHWLVTLEEFKLAKAYLKVEQRKAIDVGDVEEFLPLYHFAKWYEGGIFKFFSLKPDKRMEVQGEFLPMAFPMPYLERIKKVAKNRNIPVELIYSITRQESAFNPTIRSWADAFGLMQLTPEAAKSISRKHKIPYKSYEDLYDIETNVALGSIHLKGLKKKMKNNFIAYVASYNAGKGAVNRWLKSRFRNDPIEFIEMIPYEETQNYVKLVFRNYVTYHRMLGNKIIPNRSFFNHSK
jgi:soluble lytic murein transglycosylase